ncbi:MAG: hypothetical protein HKN24_08530 [Acidimicrobiales bacterium]|nr:hypothetical protein [Acidimicrobiales bacterium]
MSDSGYGFASPGWARVTLENTVNTNPGPALVVSGRVRVFEVPSNMLGARDDLTQYPEVSLADPPCETALGGGWGLVDAEGAVFRPGSGGAVSPPLEGFEHCVVDLSSGEAMLCAPSDDAVADLSGVIETGGVLQRLGLHAASENGTGYTLTVLGESCDAELDLSGTWWDDRIELTQSFCASTSHFQDVAATGEPVVVTPAALTGLGAVGGTTSLVRYSSQPPEVDELVLVALGDSYSSGEGAPPFEFGLNFEDAGLGPALGGPENTFAPFRPSVLLEIDGYGPVEFGADGNGCHRSLFNYSKIAAAVLDPAPVITDRTCSGAEIAPEAGGKAPIAPTLSTVGRLTQVNDAVARLTVAGYEAGEVDAVFLTMGGNDAGFGDTVAACLLPTLLVEALTEKGLGDVEEAAEFLWQRLGCDVLDELQNDVSDGENALPGKLAEAHRSVHEAFPNARILHLTYPNILPSRDNFGGEYCSSIRQIDANYAASRLDTINSAIRTEVANAQGQGLPVELVDVEELFGANALCPADAAQALAVGIPKERIDAAVDYLLTREGIGPAIEKIAVSWSAARTCLKLSKKLLPLCAGATQQPFFDGIDEVQAWLEQDTVGDSRLEPLQLIQALLAPDSFESGDSLQVLFDRSTFVFHPNRAGHVQLACGLLVAYEEPGDTDALIENCPAPSVLEFFPTIDGSVVETTEPVPATQGGLLDAIVGGWVPFTTVSVTLYSDPVALGVFTTNADGVVDTTVQIPLDTPPGIHRLVFEGEAAGVARTVTINAFIDGDPQPESEHSVYLAGFEPFETVEATLGENVAVLSADADGGVIVRYLTPESGIVTITATGEVTGPVTTQTVVADTIPPVVEPVVPAPDGANGWYVTSPVVVGWTATDPEPSSGGVITPPDVSADQQGSSTYVSEQVCDAANNCALGEVTLSIDTVAPVVEDVALSVNPIPVTETAGLTVTVSDDPAGSGVESVEYSINGGPPSPMQLTGDTASTVLDGAALGAGIYQIDATVTDVAGNVAAPLTTYLVVFDPDGAFATGGGWFRPGSATSDPGDVLPGIDGTSKAHFGFNIKYQNGTQAVPGGNLQFRYQAGDFKLKSSAFDWLVVTNNNWAKFRGTAQLDGQPGLFPFRVDARSGRNGLPDRFVIKVWAPGTNPDQTEPIYKASGDLGGGNITIHNN